MTDEKCVPNKKKKVLQSYILRKLISNIVNIRSENY